MPPSVELRRVTVRYGGVEALAGVTLRLEGPGLVQVLGPNGAGKTTLLRTIAGLVRPVEGRVLIDGADVAGRPDAAGRLAAYAPQLAARLQRIPFTPLDLVEVALRLRGVRDPRGRAVEALEAVGLPREVWGRPLHALSGGQLQRVLLARAVASGARVLLLDEPLSAVDPRGRRDVAELIGREAREKLVIAAMHDPTLLLPYTVWVVVLYNGRVAVEGPPSEALRASKLARVYGGSVAEFAGHIHLGDSHAPGGG